MTISTVSRKGLTVLLLMMSAMWSKIWVIIMIDMHTMKQPNIR